MPMAEAEAGAIYAFRHPRPNGATGRCIGRTDLAVDRRRAKRLARRAQTLQRRLQLPRTVTTSALQRCANVGRWLRRWGWRHTVDASLQEMDFGSWDGLRWNEISKSAIDAWCEDFADHAPGGGESLRQFLKRAGEFTPPASTIVIAHGGWVLARRWLNSHTGPPRYANDWSAEVPSYGALWQLARSSRLHTGDVSESAQLATCCAPSSERMF